MSFPTYKNNSFISSFFLSHIRLFHYRYPIVKYALAHLAGTLYSTYNIFGLFFLIFILCTTKAKHVFFIFLFFLFPLPIMQHTCKLPPKNSVIQGTGIFSPHSYLQTENNIWKIQGNFCEFTDSLTRKTYTRVPCYLYSFKTPSLYENYKVFGKLIHNNNNYSIFTNSVKLNKKQNNIKIIGVYFNKKCSNFIDKHFKDRNIIFFLKSLFLGHPLPGSLKIPFQNLGISHLLIISGFHFGLLTVLCSEILNWLPHKIKNGILLVVINCFTLILSPAPSITRAWISYSLSLIATLFSRTCSNINRISIAAIFILTTNPLHIFNISFQFSFLSTLGIIFFCQPIEKFLSFTINKKSVSRIGTAIVKIINFVITTLNKYLALTLSSLFFVFPLLILNFHSFYLGTFFYNILFTPLIQLAVIISCINFCIPVDFLCCITTRYISWLLQLTSRPPVFFKKIWIPKEISVYWVFLYLVIGLHIGIFIYVKNTNERRKE